MLSFHFDNVEYGPSKVIAISYSVEDGGGVVLDVATLGEPLVFMFGSGAVLPGLSQGLIGKKAGDRFEIAISPEQGFGSKGQAGSVSVRRTLFEGEVRLHMPFELEFEGETRTLFVTEVGDERVVLSADPPLAGLTLFVRGRVVAVRGASSEEEVHRRAMLEDWP
jgi:FKBP-type peptidyl-prolyl cis-trans isomerase SlyD